MKLVMAGGDGDGGDGVVVMVVIMMVMEMATLWYSLVCFRALKYTTLSNRSSPSHEPDTLMLFECESVRTPGDGDGDSDGDGDGNSRGGR